MNWNALFDEWKQGTIRPVYLFYGEEPFIRESAVQRLRQMILPEGLESMNETLLSDPEPTALIEAAETLPFMSDRRLVLVREMTLFSASKLTNEQAGQAERLLNWLQDPPPETVLAICVSGKCDERRKLFTYINKNYAAVRFDHLKDAELSKWVAGQLKADRKTMEPAALGELTFLAGYELTRLSSELEKLRAYTGGRSRITAEDVRAVVTPSTESSVFRLVDAVIARDLKTAGQLQRRLSEQGESPLGILALLTRQVRFMAYMKQMRAEGEPLESVKTRLSMTDFGAKQTDRQIRRFSVETLMNAYRACVEADYSVKSGQARDAAALDRLIFYLARMPYQA